MHIQQIAIDNFKSFHGETTIPFLEGFTTVSGPNGSGKSNIVDSVLFCLGLSTSRTLRAEKLTDLINNTARRREATVTITFNKRSKAKVSPSAKILPFHAKVTEQTEDKPPQHEVSLAELAEASLEGTEESDLVTIGRRIRESASGYTSTYYLDGKPTTLGGVHEYLARYNVSPGCYNVMMQGDVQSIVNMSAMERRKIIDEIAGVAEFDRKIEQAQRELDTTGQTIERNEILLGEIETRVEQLIGERDKALKYQGLREQKLALEAKIQLAQFKDLQTALLANRDSLANTRQQREVAREQLKALETQVAETTKALRAASEAVKRKGEDEQLAVKAKIETLHNQIARKQDAIDFASEKQAEIHQQNETANSEITRLTSVLETFDTELAALAQQQKELEGLLAQEQANYEKLNQQFDTLTDSGSETAAKRSEVRLELEKLNDELGILKRQQLDLSAEAQRCEQDAERSKQGLSDVTTRHQALQKRYEAIGKAFETLDERKDELERKVSEEANDRARLQAALNRVNDELNQLLREQTRLETRKKAYEEFNFARAVDLILNSGMDGVHGTVAQLANVPEEYSLALEIALGGRVQNVVVEDDYIAKQGIQFLKENRAGRATFLPLNKIRPARALGYAPSEAGVIDYGVNLITFDDTYTDVFSFALGDTLIVETLEDARPLLNRYRMVTLDGSVLDKSGAMTGGSQAGRSRGPVFSSSGVDGELQQLKQKIEGLQADKARIGKHLTQSDQDWQRHQQELQQLNQQHSRHLAELETLEGQLRDAETNIASLTEAQSQSNPGFARLKAIADEDKTLTAKIQRLTTQQQGLAGQLEALEQQLETEELAELRDNLQEAKFQVDYYDTQLRQVKSDVHQKNIERQIRDGALVDYKQQIEARQGQTAQLDKEKAEHQALIQQLKADIDELTAQTSELDEELKQLQAERDNLQTQLLDEEKQRHGLERQRQQAEEQALALQARIQEIERNIKAMREELAATGLDLDEAITEVLDSADNMREQIAKLTRRMEALEPVNMLAIKEYDSVQERKQELSDKLTTLTTERDTLTSKIAGYEDLKKVNFMKAFDHVNEHFKEIYAELSDGHGQLVLTKPNDPLQGGLTIEASPRGKKTQRIEAMSGGEKSLTSLAFVFSLQRYMPAPFYALDEVDMNLDGLNVEKLSRMVRRESNSAQFIVVSLRKPMLENSDRTVGVTQKKNGISKVTGIAMKSLETAPSNEPTPKAEAS